MRAATDLPWLCPSAASLTALARAPADAWEAVRTDPGAVVLVVRHTAAALAIPSAASLPTLVLAPAVLEGAIAALNSETPGFVDWSAPALRPVHVSAVSMARLAHALAAHSGLCGPETAWAAALLAPLGWFAVCAAEAGRAAACLADPRHARHPADTETHYWGADAAALSRRLAQRWGLPRWLAAVAGHLGLPTETAERLGADPAVFRIVQLAVGLAQQHGHATLGLAVRPATAEALSAVGLTPDDADALVRAAAAPVPVEVWESPASVPLLPTVLTLALDNRRLRNAPAVAALQRDFDELHVALQAQLATEAERLRTLKLGALAEFAAGAGHEINNPLAVISGQAQYLLKKVVTSEACPVTTRDCGASCPLGSQHSALSTALQTIVQQTKRVHTILTELMQFARPPRPRPAVVDAAELVREVAASLHDTAARGQVRLVCPEVAAPVALHADPQQIRTALTCLLRNAIESAPAGGWAGVRVVVVDPEQVELIVEDNGPGPPPTQREHLFDPFYSGRHAGRGRGLGLPTAWRLAREHGGDVRFECHAGGPTRFVLSLPRGRAVKDQPLAA